MARRRTRSRREEHRPIGQRHGDHSHQEREPEHQRSGIARTLLTRPADEAFLSHVEAHERKASPDHQALLGARPPVEVHRADEGDIHKDSHQEEEHPIPDGLKQPGGGGGQASTHLRGSTRWIL
jgi:hypothetical protein